MSKTIPNNTIIKSTGQGDTLGDIISSFNLDLNSNYGAIGVNRMKSLPITQDTGTFEKPIAFAKFLDLYWVLADNELWKGNGDSPSDGFTEFDTFNLLSDISEGNSDMKVFNGSLYFSGSTEVYKTTNGTSFTTPISSNLTASPHLMEVKAGRCYITEGFIKVLSFNTSDTLATSSSNTLNLTTAYGLTTEWTITSLKRIGGLLWITLLNTYNGRGLIFSWNGETADVFNSVFEMPSGIVSSTVLDNVLYVMDTQGKLKRYAGNSFVDVPNAQLSRRNKNFFNGAATSNNSRFIHPNGMITTDEGTILILLSNQIRNFSQWEDNIPSGIWEYDPNIGLYHKYSVSVSPVGGTTLTDYGQRRLSSPGALFYNKPSGSITDNGILLAGADYYTDSTTTASGVFCDDTLDTTQKYGSFITTFSMSDTEETWQKIYVTYKKLLDSNDKIFIKYRTVEDIPLNITITMTDIDRFTTSDDISSYGVGDEIEIQQGIGSGLTAHIKSISGSTYILDYSLPVECIGITTKANIAHWIKAGTGIISYSELKQIKALTLQEKNVSPFIQIKVCMLFTGKDELYKLKIINNKDIKE